MFESYIKLVMTVKAINWCVKLRLTVLLQSM